MDRAEQFRSASRDLGYSQRPDQMQPDAGKRARITGHFDLASSIAVFAEQAVTGFERRDNACRARDLAHGDEVNHAGRVRSRLCVRTRCGRERP